MSKIRSPLEVYKLLPKSDCRQCSYPTCMAFSAAVIRGDKKLADCPHVALSISETLSDRIALHKSIEDNREEAVGQLRSRISGLNILSLAERLGADVIDDRLAIKCLGKNFFVDSSGAVTSECHIHHWITVPILDYILHGCSEKQSGQWLPFRELKKGRAMAPLFEQRCEKPIRLLADTYPDIFEDIISLFGGNRSINMFSSDISLVLYPLPRVPLLICYWEPEEELESSLHIFFDSTAQNFLSIESIFSIGVGLALMFEKVISTHKHR